MLTKDEEAKVEGMIGALNNPYSPLAGVSIFTIPREDFVWLATKLKETNDELSDLKKSVARLSVVDDMEPCHHTETKENVEDSCVTLSCSGCGAILEQHIEAT